MPNLFAFFTLLLWPMLSIVFFRKLDTVTAVFWTIVGGYLLLPVKVAIDLPLIPPLNKESIPAISAILGCILIKKIKIYWIPQKSIERWLVVGLLLSTVLTTITNGEPVFNGKIWISGLTFHDGLSSLIRQYFFLIPFILGVQLIKTYEDQIKLFKYLVIAGLCYSLPILFEIRMSPQLHTWIYGFFPHSFLQTARGGGFRAVVFLGHGLLVASFIAISLGSAAVMLKSKYKTFGIPSLLIIAILFLVLVLSKTVGAFILGVFLVIAITAIPLNISIVLALFLTVVVVTYPFLSILELFPHQELVNIVDSFSNERAQSLDYRFMHESLLLDHAKEKLFFGWGEWGRNRMWNSVTDGAWINIFSVSGLWGFIAFFNLPLLGILRGKKSFNFIGNKMEKNVQVGHILIVSIILVDQLPNASLSGFVMFYIGALIGRSNYLLKPTSNKNA